MLHKFFIGLAVVLVITGVFIQERFFFLFGDPFFWGLFFHFLPFSCCVFNCCVSCPLFDFFCYGIPSKGNHESGADGQQHHAVPWLSSQTGQKNKTHQPRQQRERSNKLHTRRIRILGGTTHPLTELPAACFSQLFRFLLQKRAPHFVAEPPWPEGRSKPYLSWSMQMAAVKSPRRQA